jgi:hypothetical protein
LEIVAFDHSDDVEAFFPILGMSLETAFSWIVSVDGGSGVPFLLEGKRQSTLLADRGVDLLLLMSVLVVMGRGAAFVGVWVVMVAETVGRVVSALSLVESDPGAGLRRQGPPD